MIPRVLHRCVPATVPPRFEDHWTRWKGLHPGWVHRSWQDPIDPTGFPITSPAWPHVQAGAALAGLVRLEALYRYGGIFLDWDVRPVRNLAPLLDTRCFAAWEDDQHIPDAVFGCTPGHPAIGSILYEAIDRTIAGRSIWECSVGLFTEVLQARDDVTILSTETFYPVHYTTERDRPGASARHEPGPDTYGVHEWAWSWRTPTDGDA